MRIFALAILFGASCCAAQQYTRAQKEQIKKTEQEQKTSRAMQTHAAP